MTCEITKILGLTRYHYLLTDSTNKQAKKLIDDYSINADKVLVTATKQTSGKGRANREWVSQEGNLFLSIIPTLRKDISKEIYTYITALSVSKALESISTKKNPIRPSIKWPNDVLLEQKKLCGILLEIHNEKLIIGVGVNINSAPEYDDNLSSSCLLEYLNKNSEITSETFLIEFLKMFNESEKLSLEKIISEIRTRLFKASAEVSINNTKKKNAKIIDIDEKGLLIIETENGIEKLNHGEIFF